ncbi:MAG: histidinol-phosphate transaminase [Clostridia bacterium]|nr:histidinol-phosphate transaminase [Clostridia bacterium]
MSKFLACSYGGLAAYVPGEQPRDRKYIKLNTNESPYPPSPKVIAAIAEKTADMNLYPDPEYRSFREKAAAYHGVGIENVSVGGGSDELLDWIFRAFFPDRGVIFPDVTYGFYKVWAALYGIKYREIPLRDDFTVDPADYTKTEKGGPCVVLADPNAPTGIAAGLDAIETIVAADPDRVVVIDEAYADFSSYTAAPLVKKYDNLIVVRTFSKSRSFAGGRVGYCLASPEIIKDIEFMRFSTNPFNLSRTACAAAEASFDDDDYFRARVADVVRVRDEFSAALCKLGFEVTESSSNFVFAKFPGKSGRDLAAALRERGILIRRFDSERIKDHLRITVGTAEQMSALVGALADILKG